MHPQVAALERGFLTGVNVDPPRGRAAGRVLQGDLAAAYLHNKAFVAQAHAKLGGARGDPRLACHDDEGAVALRDLKQDYRVQTGNFAFAGIDMALWDLCGKACGQPLHRLFGGPVQEAIDYFYYLAQGTPEELRAQCRDGVARGYRCFYLKVGIDAAAEEAMLEAVRATVGVEARIRIDANEAWSVPEAAGLLRRWHDRFGIDFAEAPVPIFPLERMRELRARTPVALCANEGLGSQADAYRVITGGVTDIVCFSSFWVGTLRRFHTLASLAGLLGIGVCKHTHGELGIAASAAHHLVLTLANATPGAQQTAAIMADDVLTTPLPIAAGPRWGVPEAPGLGVEVDEIKLAAFAEAYRRDGQFLPYAA